MCRIKKREAANERLKYINEQHAKDAIKEIRKSRKEWDSNQG